MALNVTISFSGDLGATDPLPGLAVHRYEIRDALSEIFEVTLFVASTELSADMQQVVGHEITIQFKDEPYLDQMAGIVRRARQLTSVLSNNDGDGSAYYELVVVPPLWLATRRRDCRIFEKKSVTTIAAEVLSAYTPRQDAPQDKLVAKPEPREYCVQYGESDHQFIARIYAEEGVVTRFDHSAGSVLTLMDDTATQSHEVTGSITFDAASQLSKGEAHVSNVLVSAEIETSWVTLRDYDHENPRLDPLEGKEHPFDAGYFTREARLEAYSYGVGRFRSSKEGDPQAERELSARRAGARTFTCEASFAMPPGHRFTLSGHPRAELNKQLLVVRAHSVVDDGVEIHGKSHEKRSVHRLECIDAEQSFFPLVPSKHHIAGNQTAFVVGATPEGTVDVDEYGRVELLFRWDRRDPAADPPKRRVRVSQAWAGNGFGFVTLPRIGDEVVVSYADGDPDQPLVVGRVHNKTVPTPLNLPGEKTQAVWWSRSFNDGGPSDGYNRILMDDQTGAERLEIHAQRDFKSETGHDSVTTVGNNASSNVTGNSSHKVGGAYSLSSGSTSISTGAYSVSATTITESARTNMTLTAGDKRTDKSANHFLESGSFYVTLDDVFQINAAHLHAFCGSSIKLVCGGSSIVMTPGGIKITSSGIVEINGGLVKLNCF